MASVSCFGFFGCKVCGILIPWPGTEPSPSALEGDVLTTGLPGKTPFPLDINLKFFLLFHLLFFPITLLPPYCLLFFLALYLTLSASALIYKINFKDTPLVTQTVKNPPAMWETWVQSLGWEDPLEKGKATHSSILAWRIPWTVQTIRLQSLTWLSHFHFLNFGIWWAWGRRLKKERICIYESESHSVMSNSLWTHGL